MAGLRERPSEPRELSAAGIGIAQSMPMTELSCACQLPIEAPKWICFGKVPQHGHCLRTESWLRFGWPDANAPTHKRRIRLGQLADAEAEDGGDRFGLAARRRRPSTLGLQYPRLHRRTLPARRAAARCIGQSGEVVRRAGWRSSFCYLRSSARSGHRESMGSVTGSPTASGARKVRPPPCGSSMHTAMSCRPIV